MEADLAAALHEGIGWDRIAAGFITAQGDVRDHGNTAIVNSVAGTNTGTAQWLCTKRYGEVAMFTFTKSA